MAYPDSLQCSSCGEQITEDETAVTERSNVMGDSEAKKHFHLRCRS